MFCCVYEPVHIDSRIVQLIYLLASKHCMYQVVQTSVDILTLGNYIVAIFYFHFLYGWLNVPCPSIE